MKGLKTTESRNILLFSIGKSRVFWLSEAGVKDVAASSEANDPIKLDFGGSINPWVQDEEEEDDFPGTARYDKGHGCSASSQGCGKSIGPILISYEGQITKFVDSATKEFELDGQHRLVLSYCPLINNGHSIRVGSRVRLHNIHLILMDQVRYSRRPPLQGRRVILAACLYTTVEMAAFSEEICVQEPLGDAFISQFGGGTVRNYFGEFKFL
jgi:hypothetical protein